jgi:16S rRNA (cytidine1402-2'-O)-methyltransferase
MANQEKKTVREPANLYLVPSPVGNLADMTYRAVTILQQVDAILCEDTRTSGVLLRHYNIQKPLTPYHLHNEHKILAHVIGELKAGKTYALLTDAGTPGISDPGFLLARACVKEGLSVECLPGATAFVPALVQSTIPSNRFCFEGFFPQKKGRHTLLTNLATESRTMIFYESPHRLARTLQDMATYWGAERLASVSRELTKMFEETKRGTLTELAEYYTKHPPKGEIVIVVAGAEV